MKAYLRPYQIRNGKNLQVFKRLTFIDFSEVLICKVTKHRYTDILNPLNGLFINPIHKLPVTIIPSITENLNKGKETTINKYKKTLYTLVRKDLRYYGKPKSFFLSPPLIPALTIKTVTYPLTSLLKIINDKTLTFYLSIIFHRGVPI